MARAERGAGLVGERDGHRPAGSPAEALDRDISALGIHPPGGRADAGDTVG